MATIVGIDSSLTSLGLACFRNGSIAAAARVRSKGSVTDSLEQRFARAKTIVAQVYDFVDVYIPDMVVIEAPSYASKFGHAHDRSGLWWGIVGVLLTAGYPVVEVPPSNRMKYATGKGNAQKDLVLAAAIRRYPAADITGNDVADAVVLAAMGSRYMGTPAEDSLPQAHLAAMEKISWVSVAQVATSCARLIRR